MIPQPGPALDNEVAERLREPKSPIVPYSTDPAAVNRLVTSLEREATFAACEQVDGLWYCVLTGDVAGVRQRIASGSGETRSLALCRAVVNLPVRHPSASSETAGPSPFKRGFCQDCGASLEKGARSQARYCPVCAYRRGKPAHAAFELTRHSGRRRRAARPQST